jgi:hypothetical protein
MLCPWWLRPVLERPAYSEGTARRCRSPVISIRSGAVGVEAGGEVSGQLRQPRAGRVPGQVQQVYPAGPVSGHECRIQPGQGERAVHVQEVDRQDGLGMGAQKCAPPVTACSRRRDPPATQELAERVRAEEVYEATYAPMIVLRS